MVIGYAAYNTTINIYGNGKLAENLSDFKVYLSNIKVNGKEVSGINNTKDGFTINDINGTLEYEITNDSTEYDTESYLECVKEDENVGKSWNFDYTGTIQNFLTPADGRYKLETWGAQGGDGTYPSSSSAIGGYGGYSVGTYSLIKNAKLFILIGGKGTSGVMPANSSATNTVSTGGFNGGGNGSNAYDGQYFYGTGGGGGATNISYNNDLLKNGSSGAVLIASGGGGGGSLSWSQNEGYNKYVGGSGGGYIGGNGTGWPNYSYGIGGTQSLVSNVAYAGLFGAGGDGATGGAGGGSGYYGGTGSRTWTSAGGGSGYIGNSLLTEKSMYCYNCQESSEESTKTISTTCTSATPASACTKSGNGYARITLISSPTSITTDKITISAQESTSQDLKNVNGKILTCKLKVNKISRTEKKEYTGPTEWTFDYTGGEQTLTAPTTGTYKLEVWGAQGGENANKFAGAAGAYSSGEITLMKGQKFYIYVGGKNGYNGGGSPSTQAYPANIGGYGGGATDIRLINGTWNNFESLKSRIMVAGGGGGAGGTAHTGTEYQVEPTVTGYGLNGNGGISHCTSSNCGGLGGDDLAGFGAGANGDTQSLVTRGDVSDKSHLIGENGKNGTFGIGGTGGSSGVYYYNLSSYKNVYSGGSGAGGGGGYFGGGGGAGSNGWWGDRGGSGGGGSSFVSGNTSSKAISSDSTANNIIYLSSSVHYSGLYFDNSKMLSGNESIPSHDGASSTKGNKGNGYARITLISY